MVITELVHRQITLSLGELSMERLSIIAVANQLIGDILGLQTGTAEDYGLNLRIEVSHTFQSIVFVFSLNKIIDMVHVLSTFVS